MNVSRASDAAISSAQAVSTIDVALLVLSRLWSLAPFASIIDIGCGSGAWLFAARQLGASRVVGVDSGDIDRSALLIHPSEFIAADLDGRFSLKAERRFDLCLCLEVAQYLHPGRSRSLVEDLTALSDVVFFAAALPFQEEGKRVHGTWHEYWARLFKGHDYLPWTGARDAIWDCRQIPWCYRQDVILFVKASSWDRILPGERPASVERLTVVHPEHYVQKVVCKDLTHQQNAFWLLRQYYTIGLL
jgi:SAM-dependent methyltransferase